MARKKKNWLPFEEARRIIRDECIPSFGKWAQWYENEKPAQIPKRPNRVYKEWTNWGDFLGTNNKFEPKNVKWRSYEEAQAFVHPLEIRSREHWLEYCRGDFPDMPEKPDTIPARAELIYSDVWISWKHFLGSRAKERVEAQQKLETLAVLAIIQVHGHPVNTFVARVHKGGISALREAREAGGKFTILGTYRWAKGFDLDTALRNAGAVPYYQYSERDEWLAPNINEVTWQLMNELDIVKL